MSNSKVLTARAWCFKYDGALHPMEITPEWISPKQVPVTIIEAYPVEDVLAGLDLLAKSREVCIHERWDSKETGPTYTFVTDCGKVYDAKEIYTKCACGSGVKAGPRV